MLKIKVGDRVYVKPHHCSGSVVEVEWQEVIEGTPIGEGYIYWVKLDDHDLKPICFGDHCLELITV